MAGEFDRQKHKYNNIRLRSDDPIDFLDEFLKFLCLNYAESDRLKPTQRRIMAHLIVRQKKKGVIKDNDEWAKVRAELVKLGVAGSESVVNTEKSNLKTKKWIHVKDQQVSVSSELVKATAKGYLCISLSFKDRPVVYEPEKVEEEQPVA